MAALGRPGTRVVAPLEGSVVPTKEEKETAGALPRPGEILPSLANRPSQESSLGCEETERSSSEGQLVLGQRPSCPGEVGLGR